MTDIMTTAPERPQQDETRPSRRGVLRRTATVVGLALAFLPVACGGQAVGAADTPAGGLPLANVRQGEPLDDGRFGFGEYLAARHAQDVSDTAAAAEYYVQALAFDPDNVALARRAYFFLLCEGRYDEALDLARRTLELDPEATVAPLVLAAGAAAQEDYAAAYDFVKDLEPIGLNSFMVPLIQAWVLAGQNRVDDALDALEPLSGRDQLGTLFNFHSGLILEQANRNKEAWQHYEAATANAGSLTLRTVEVVASFLQRQGRNEEARALVDRYKAEHPDSVLIEAVFESFNKRPADARPIAEPRQGLAEAFYGAGSSVTQSNALETGLVFVRLALLLHSDFPYAQMMVGDILRAQERWSAAAAAYSAVDVDSPVYLPVRLQYAEVLERLERPEEAVTVLEMLTAEFPKASEALVQLGDLMRRQERWNDAVEAYRKALSRLESLDRSHWTIYYSLGVALERAGRWPEAEEAFLAALELEPDQPLVLNYLGYSWIDQGINLQRGKELIEKAVRQRPNDGFIVDSLGWAYYLLGDYERAVVELERAVELTPADPTINDHLGDAYWQVGRRIEARFQWSHALSLDPEPDQAKRIARKLEEGLAKAEPKKEF